MQSTVKQYNLSIIKTDSIMTGIKLGGATFDLYRYGSLEDQNDRAWHIINPEDGKERITNDSGRLDIDGLYYNYYYKLVETKAPEGYKALSKPIYIHNTNLNSPVIGTDRPEEITDDDISDIILENGTSQDYELPIGNNPEDRKLTVDKI